MLVILLLIQSVFLSSLKESPYGLTREFYVKLFLEDLEKVDPLSFSRKLLLNQYEPLSYGPDHVVLHASQDELTYFEDSGRDFELLDSGTFEVPLDIEGYHTLEEVNSVLYSREVEYASIARVVDLTEKFGKRTTYEGRSILGLRLTNFAVQKERPKFLLVAAHHSREILTVELALDLIEFFLSSYGEEDDITTLLDENELYIVPVVNVDGYVYVHERDKMWRKNRVPYGPKDAESFVGVDLNRNYQFSYGTKFFDMTTQELDEHGCISYRMRNVMGDPRSEVYRGPHAFSESESETIAGMAEKLNFAKVLDFHSWGRIVFHKTTTSDLSGSNNCESFHGRIDAMLTRYLQIVTNYTLGNYASPEYSKYGAVGCHNQYHFEKSTYFSILFEVGTKFHPAFFSEGLDEIEMIRPAIRQLLTEPIPIQGYVVDDATDVPVDCFVSVKEIEWTMFEQRRSANGLFHLWLPAGHYTLQFFGSRVRDVHEEVVYYDGVNPVMLDVRVVAKLGFDPVIGFLCVSGIVAALVLVIVILAVLQYFVLRVKEYKEYVKELAEEDDEYDDVE